MFETNFSGHNTVWGAQQYLGGHYPRILSVYTGLLLCKTNILILRKCLLNEAQKTTQVPITQNFCCHGSQSESFEAKHLSKISTDVWATLH